MDKHISELMKIPITESVFEHLIFISVLSSLDKIQFFFENFVIYLVLVVFDRFRSVKSVIACTCMPELSKTIWIQIIIFGLKVFPGLKFAREFKNLSI